MAGFLSAHGYAPGPTQRPLLAGALSGVVATVPAIAVLLLFGTLEAQTRILGTSIGVTLAAGWVAMSMAGAVYARLFGRAANDKRGGWLFGAAFGFAIWSAGAILIFPLVTGGRALAGEAALGVFVSLVLWGVTLGVLVPFVHRPLHANLDEVSKRAESGPTAATSNGSVRRS